MIKKGKEISVKLIHSVKAFLFFLLLCSLISFYLGFITKYILDKKAIKSEEITTQEKDEQHLISLIERESLFLRRQNTQTFIITAYTPIDEKEGRFSGITSTESLAIPQFSCAVDPSVVPLGSWVWIERLGWFRAVDTGNLVKGNQIDICVYSRETAEKFGKQKRKVIILN